MKIKRAERLRLFSALAVAFLSAMQASPVHAQLAEDPLRDLSRLSIEELMEVEITSASRTGESLRSSATAVSVVTSEDIRRSGASTVPEALRGVPGVFVGQRNSNSWAVSARGFSSVNSEKLLVLSDTRSVYTPLFSGVFWDVQNYLMEDIERIEVIRGPGASLWGSNAMNGVISITTKEAKDTQGLLMHGGGGTEDRAITAVRYGGKVGDDLYYRIYGRYFERDDTYGALDPNHSDDWRMAHFGFRSDYYATDQDTLTIQGDAYSGEIGQLGPAVQISGRPGPEGDLEADLSGGNILARWRRKLRDNSEMELRAYYDRTNRDDPSFDDTLDTMDVDFQHKFHLTPSQEVTWGGTYRYMINDNDGKGIFAVEPSRSEDDLVSGFVQDQVTLFDRLRVTLGTKLEHNDFSGFEVQPTARTAWDVTQRHTVWSAISRAVRVPTRLERDVNIDAADPASDPLPRLIGNDDFDSEELIAYELGYRWQALESLAFDLAAFYNEYEGLASLELAEPFVDPDDGRTIIPIVNQNLLDGHSRGAEALVSYAPLSWWRLTGSYSYISLSLVPRGMDINRGRFHEGSTPRHQFGLRSYIDLPAGFEFDMMFRSIGEIESSPDITDGSGIDDYSELSVRLGWLADENLEFSIIGRNLLHDRHLEAGAPEARGEIERSVYGEVILRF